MPASLQNPLVSRQAKFLPLSSEGMDDVEVIEISSSPSSQTSLPESQFDSTLQQDVKNDNAAVEMSSDVGTAVSDHAQSTGGTCFLDLPPELRTMVYDLAIPNDYRWQFPMPGKPRSAVKGITLLQSCRQVRQETSDRIWNRPWYIDYRPRAQDDNKAAFDCALAMSALHDFAMAKVTDVTIRLFIPDNPNGILGFKNLGDMQKLTSLEYLHISVMESPYMVGIVIRILSHVPNSSCDVYWHLHCRSRGKSLISDDLQDLADNYKSLRGSAYKSQANKSRKNPIEVSP